MAANLDKIDWLSLAAFNNAVRLHGDALALYKQGRYPSSFQLSVLSQEEIGKAHIASKFVYTSKSMMADGHKFTPQEEKDFLELMYKHPIKQGYFLSTSSPGMNMLFRSKGRKIYKSVFEGKTEVEKQNATYVSLQKKNKKLNVNGRVLQPNVSRSKAEQQITIVNDYLIEACIGHIFASQDFEISNIKRVLNRRLLKELKRDWRYSSIGTREYVRNSLAFAKSHKIKLFN